MAKVMFVTMAHRKAGAGAQKGNIRIHQEGCKWSRLWLRPGHFGKDLEQGSGLALWLPSRESNGEDGLSDLFLCLEMSQS